MPKIARRFRNHEEIGLITPHTANFPLSTGVGPVLAGTFMDVAVLTPGQVALRNLLLFGNVLTLANPTIEVKVEVADATVLAGSTLWETGLVEISPPSARPALTGAAKAYLLDDVLASWNIGPFDAPLIFRVTVTVDAVGLDVATMALGIDLEESDP